MNKICISIITLNTKPNNIWNTKILVKDCHPLCIKKDICWTGIESNDLG